MLSLSMEKVKRLSPVAGLFALLLLSACESELPEAPLTTYLDLPASPYYYGEGNINDQATLGRVLFYDRQLSINNSLSCASCHKQSLAFSDDARFSKGFGSKLTSRNSMPIQNLGSNGFIIGFNNTRPLDSLISFDSTINGLTVNGFFQKVLFWDGREQVLDKMVLRPIVNHVEMGITNLDAFEEKLASISYYPELFEAAFGSNQITTEKVGNALAAFLGTITSNNTKLDQVNKGTAHFTTQELKGQQLFIEKYDCNSCHQVGFTDGYIFAGTFANVGLDEEYQDAGLALVTKNANDAGKFKIPSLRNVSLTAPYMHDGRFETLEDVIDHYSETIADNPNLDDRLRDSQGSPLRLNISSDEKQAIIAFLHTLTDHEMVRDVRFSDPFKIKK